MNCVPPHRRSQRERTWKKQLGWHDGKVIGIGTTDELLTSVSGKVFTAKIGQSDLAYCEKLTRIVSIKGEGDSSISVRYISDTQDIPNSQTVEPHLEDLYLWLFRQETAREGDFDAES